MIKERAAGPVSQMDPTTATDDTVRDKSYSKKSLLNISKKNKDNSKNICNCCACKDSEYEYKINDLILEDNSPLIFQTFGRDLTK